jgi:nucleoid-associated protein YgaU
MGLFDKLKGKDSDKKDAKSDRRVADFSDVQGSSSSMPADAGKTYTVAPGDSLSKIAQREYGDAGKWRHIFAANQGIISNPDLIHPGQVLTIPRDV